MVRAWQKKRALKKIGPIPAEEKIKYHE
jgi:hypothetical protein